MSELEKTFQEEVERLQRWREGRDFTLSTFNAGTNRCGRCHMGEAAYLGSCAESED